MHGSSVLIPPKLEQRSAQAGMRTSLRETQASREGESHAQEANVAEVSYGKPVIGEPAYPSANIRTTRRWASRGDARLTRPINRWLMGWQKQIWRADLFSTDPRTTPGWVAPGSLNDHASERQASRPDSSGRRV